jgi:hypothetical protein
VASCDEALTSQAGRHSILARSAAGFVARQFIRPVERLPVPHVILKPAADRLMLGTVAAPVP